MFISYVLRGRSGKKSMLIALDDIFPECKSLTAGTTLPRISCLQVPNSCFKGIYITCMSTIVKRAYQLFRELEDLELIILHWIQDSTDEKLKGKRYMGMIIERDERKELVVSPLNRWAVAAIQERIGRRYAVDFGIAASV